MEATTSATTQLTQNLRKINDEDLNELGKKAKEAARVYLNKVKQICKNIQALDTIQDHQLSLSVKTQGQQIVQKNNEKVLKDFYISTIKFQSVINEVADNKKTSVLFTLDSNDKIGVFEIKEESIEDFVNDFVQAGWSNGKLTFKYAPKPLTIDGRKVFNPISYSDLQTMVERGKASSVTIDKKNGEMVFSQNLTSTLKALQEHINTIQKENPLSQEIRKKQISHYSQIRGNILTIRQHQKEYKESYANQYYKKIKNNTRYISKKLRDVFIENAEKFITIIPEDKYQIIIDICSKTTMKSEDLQQIKDIFIQCLPIKETNVIYKFSDNQGIQSEYAKVTNLGYLVEALTGAIFQIQKDQTKLSYYMQSVDSVSGLLQGDFTFENFEIAVKGASSQSLSIYQVVYVAEQIVKMNNKNIPQFLYKLKIKLKEDGSKSGKVSEKDLENVAKRIYDVNYGTYL